MVAVGSRHAFLTPVRRVVSLRRLLGAVLAVACALCGLVGSGCGRYLVADRPVQIRAGIEVVLTFRPERAAVAAGGGGYQLYVTFPDSRQTRDAADALRLSWSFVRDDTVVRSGSRGGRELLGGFARFGSDRIGWLLDGFKPASTVEHRVHVTVDSAPPDFDSAECYVELWRYVPRSRPLGDE